MPARRAAPPPLVLAFAALLACGTGEPPRDRDGGAPGAPAAAGIPADSFSPGTVLRYGPMPDRTPAAPVVNGARGQITIYDGYFLRGGCHGGLSADADEAGDTIVLTLLSRPDPTRPEPCDSAPVVLGYAALVGTLPVGDHVLRVVHAGEARESPVDSTYTVTVAPKLPR